MAKAHYFIEANRDGSYQPGLGAWVEVTDRIHGQGHQVAFQLTGQLGQLTVTPPARVDVDNTGGWWLDQLDVSGGDFEGRWEGRRFQIRLEKASGVHVLGTYRVALEDGLQLNRSGLGTLKLEPLTKVLERADASGVSDGLGWYQSVPWTLALQKLLLGEPMAQVASWPDCVLDYHYIEQGCSLLGRPGDFQFNGTVPQWHRVDAVAVDVCWNSEAEVFCFATTQGLYEWDPATGAYDEVTLSFSLGTTKDILRVWFKPWNGDGFYFVLTGVRGVSSQSSSNLSGYWQPKDQAYNSCSTIELWASDRSTVLKELDYSNSGCQVAPVIYRESCLPLGASNTDHYQVGAERIFLDTQYRYFENLTIPFGQYLAVLFNRRDQSGEVPGNANDIISQTVEYHVPDEDRQDPLYSWTAPAENTYVMTPRPGAGARQGMNMDELRMGRGFYASDTEVTSTYDPDDATDAGARYSLGQGPMVDISWPSYGDGSSNGRWDCWAVYAEWIGGAYSYWQLRVVKVNNYSGASVSTYQAVLDTFDDRWQVPTFIVCDITRDEDYSGGCVMVGWFRYNTGDTYEFVDPKEGWKVRPAESGLALYFVDSAAHNAAPTFFDFQRFLTFTPEADGDGDTQHNRYYWTTAPAYLTPGTVYHASGRWTPVAAGFSRVRIEAGEEIIYRILLSCLDRSECLPDPVTQRTGMPYKLMVLTVHAWDDSVTLLFNDTEGGGHDLQWSSALPPMGFTRLQADTQADADAWADEAVYFYNPADRSLYRMAAAQDWRPQWIARVPAADPYLQLGVLALDDPGGASPQVAGVTSPVFPLTGATRWPVGEYYGWLYGDVHSGRVPLLDLEGLTKWKALGLVTQLADAHYYFDRSGRAQLRQVQLQDQATPVITLMPSDYAQATRGRVGLMNQATRSVNDVMPGDLSVTVRLTPKSEWNLSPGVSGMGLYPVNLELMCIAGGMVSEVVDEDEVMGRTGWAWRETGKVLEYKLSQNSSGQVLYFDTSQNVDVGDLVTLGIDDQDLEITALYDLAPASLAILASSLSREYKAGDTIHLVKRAQAHWSHQLWWDQAQSRYRGVGIVAAAASSGATLIEVESSHPFSEGCLFTIGRSFDDFADDDAGVLRCIRIRKAREEADLDHDVVELEALGGSGLPHAVSAGDPICVWLNIGPASRSVQVGQTGVLFTVHGGAGGTAQDNTEKPVHEGDRILVSYPGLVSKKNQNAKVTAHDWDSLRAHGKQAGKLQPNPFMDYNLALMDVQRAVSRGADDRLRLTLKSVAKIAGGEDTDLLEPLDVVRVTDDLLLPDRDGYTSLFMVTGHQKVTDQPGADLTLEELPGAVSGRTEADAQWTPADLDDLELWFRAAKLVQDGARDGGTVNLWLDESGNHRHAYNTSGYDILAPVLTMLGDDTDIPVVEFNGAMYQRLEVGDYEVHSNSSGYGLHVTVIGRKTEAGDSDSGTFISKYDTGKPGAREWFCRVAAFTAQDASGSEDANTIADLGGDEVLRWLYGEWDVDSGAVTGYTDGNLEDTAASTVTDITDTIAKINLGCDWAGASPGHTLTGMVAEIIVTSRPLTSTELVNLAAYIRRQSYAVLLEGMGAGRAFSNGFSSGLK